MKYSINFIPDKCKSNTEEGNVRMVVQWSGGGRVSLAVGHRVILSKWSRDAQRCKQGTTHGKYMAAVINKDIQSHEDAANKVMQSFDAIPTPENVKNALLKLLGRAKSDAKKGEGEDIVRDITTFIIEESKSKSWSLQTVKSFRRIKSIFKEYGIACYDDINSPTAQDKLIRLLQEKELTSSSINLYIGHINWFLRWCEKKAIIKRACNYKPRLKTAPRKVIYLTIEELMRLYNADFTSKARRRLRDLYCFCCFTGLRHSDAIALRTDNIRDGYISIISKKDTDDLHIELNRYARMILDRVELDAGEITAGYALPHIELNNAEQGLRRLAKSSGINEPISVVYYRGGKRVESRKEKWELITTHTARKTFICTALSMGISPVIVMKWTGHSGYNAMQPYVDVLDTAKKKAMSAFDSISAE